ncbi:histidine phosphatase [Aggregicoccus sp. 17bor-14]|uniref:SixA phosphatase family protein n=1 Tax=Myxococcaceae TaxID=31 RepID=UPI00129CEA6C|nr:MULTISPECIES: histidine phosphatase family protein [Myxococcaceae]MBF5042723.1 histidine phosphatase family protein [Simulacricoccus sp. 17bor-14]MRI88491.1 histidine phosphatase [Aggregicoccus sp. 17bor-14]
MRIFLVRHADADAEIPEGLGDEARALTAKARQAALAHFTSLSERMGPISLVLASPLVRTVQTAQILSLATKHEGSLKAHRCLLPDMPVGAVESVLAEHAGQHLALVGHQPSMGALAAHLLGMQAFPKPVSPGTVIALERSPEASAEPARLLFYAAPGQQVLDSINP